MAKLDRDEVLRRGEARLNEWGVRPDADAVALRAHAHRDASADLAIAARLGAQPHAESVALLNEIEARSDDKSVHKEVKRTLYRLEQRGIARAAESTTPRAAPLLGPQIEGYLSPLDGRGDQLVWLVRAVPGGGIAHLLAVINDPDGMRDTALHHTTRKALRTARQDLETKHEIRLVDADWRYCDFLMDRAFRWTQARGTAIDGDFPGLRAQLVRTPAPTDLPPLIWSMLDVTTIRNEPALLATSASLLEEKEFRTWFFDVETLKPYLDEMLHVKDSPLVLTPAQQQERFSATIGRAVEELFNGERQASYARRLLTMAYVFAMTQRLDPARRAGAVALALEGGTQGGRDIPLCEQLVRTSLAAFFQMAAEEEQEQARSSLIMTPQQAAAQAARQTRR